jgi:DNA invertase Pin-like site-specific DNA recombinase
MQTNCLRDHEIKARHYLRPGVYCRPEPRVSASGGKRVLRAQMGRLGEGNHHYRHGERAKTSREGLDRLMTLVRRGKVDVIACYKLDRLGRSLPHLAQIISELDQHDISLVATSQGIDTNHDSPAGRLQMHVLIAVAEFERSLIVQRVRAGQAAARAKGVKFGRPATLWKHRERVVSLLQQGISCRQIAAQTGLPLGSVFNISRTLHQLSNGEAPPADFRTKPAGATQRRQRANKKRIKNASR